MSDEKVEGKEKKCGNCKEDLICVKVLDTYQNRNTEKLQWQTKKTGKAHFKYAGPNNWKCNIITPEEIVQESMEDMKPDKTLKVEVDTTIKVAGPFDEAELMARWASDRAYKMVMAGIENANKLSPQEKSGLGQKEGMLTRLLVDTVLELRKQNGIKSEYAK